MGLHWVLPPSWPQPTDDYTLQPCNHYRRVATFLPEVTTYQQCASVVSSVLIWYKLQGLAHCFLITLQSLGMRGTKDMFCSIIQIHVITVVVVETLWDPKRSSPGCTTGYHVLWGDYSTAS